MRAKLVVMGVVTFLTARLVAGAQDAPRHQMPSVTHILMKTAANYRACQTFRAQTEWTRRVADKVFNATLELSAQRPNLFRLSAKGAYFDTEVACDGKELLALRPARMLFTRSPAPKQILGTDILKGIVLPAPATRILALFLEGRWQDRSDPLVQRLHAAEVTGHDPLGDAMTYVLTFDYDVDYTARLYVSDGDWLLRRVALYRKGQPEIVETVVRTSLQPVLATDVFRLTLPNGAIRTAVLPKPEEPEVPVPLSLETVDGRRITLSDLRGSVVLLTFFFTACPYCNEEVQHLQQVYERFRAAGLEIIAVNGTGEAIDEIKRWRDQYGLTFHVARNRTPTDFVALYNIKAYPTTVIYDRDGKLVYKVEGYDPQGILKALQEHGIRQ